MKKMLIGCLASILAASLQGAITYGTETIADVVDDSETAVNVDAGATLALSGDNSFAAARLTLGAGSKLVCAEGVESAVIRVKDIVVNANCVVDTGVTLVGDFVSQTVKGKTFTVNGTVKTAAQIYSDTGLSIFSGTGTIWADNLSVRNSGQKALDNAGAGQLTFYNHRINLRGTGSTKSIIERQWGHYRFQNAVFGFWGQDTKWERGGEGTRQTRIPGQNDRIIFDTLDAEDGVTPRTFTWSSNSVLPDVLPTAVVKTNPGTMIVGFNLSSYLTGGTVVEGGTLRYNVVTPSFNGATTVKNEGSVLDLSSANNTVTFNGALTIDQGTLNIPNVQDLTVGGAFTLTGTSFAPPLANSVKFNSSVAVSGGDLRFPSAGTVTCGGALTIKEGSFVAPNASATVGGKLTLGTNAVVSVAAGHPLSVSGGTAVTGPATITFDLPANSTSGIYPIIQGFGADTPIDDLTLTLAYSGPLQALIKKDGPNLVAVATTPPLTWKGGNGNWTDVNWLTPENETVGWSNGATARLPAGTGTIALTDDITAEYIDVVGDWTLTGAEQTLTISLSTMNVNDGGKLTCGVKLGTGDVLTKSGAGRLDYVEPVVPPTTVNVNSGVLGLVGENDWSAATVKVAFGATLGSATEGASVTIGDFKPSRGAVVGAGLSVQYTTKMFGSDLNGIVVDGDLHLLPTSGGWGTSNTFELSSNAITGSGTVHLPALGMSSGAAGTFRNLTLAFTGSDDHFVGRMWGTYDLYDVTLTFSGGDLSAVAGDTNNNAIRFQGLCTIDTLDAEDGSTPRTVTFDYLPSQNVYIQVGESEGGVRKINPGVVLFGVPARWKGETRVEGGTFIHRNLIASSSITVTGADTVFSNQCDNVAYTRYSMPVTLLDGARFGSSLPPRFSALNVGGTSRLAFPLSAGTLLPATRLQFNDNTASLAFELEMAEALPKGSYALLESEDIRASDVNRFSVSFPQGLPAGVVGTLLVRDGSVRYLVTESPKEAVAATWFGDGSTANWGEGANWDLAEAPFSGLSLLFSGRHNLTNAFNLAGNSYNNLTFTGSAGPFAITGIDPLDLAGAIVNASQERQKLDVPVSFIAETAVVEQADGAEGSLVFAKNLNATALRLNGDLQAEIDGAATVAGEVFSAGSNVAVSGSGSLVSGGNLAVAGGATFSWGVDNSRFTGGLSLQGKSSQLFFTGGTTVFEAETFANMNSGNLYGSFTIADGATLHINYIHSSQVYYMTVDGELNVHDMLSISPGMSYEWIKGAGTVAAAGVRIHNNANLQITVPRLYVGELGFHVVNYNGTCSGRFGAASTTIAPADSDFRFQSTGSTYFDGSQENNTVTTINTVDTNGVARTITFEHGLAGGGEFAVDGSGTFVLAPSSAPFTGIVDVRNGATVALQTSIGNCGSVVVDNGGLFRVDADELVLPKSVSVQNGGTFATGHLTTLNSPKFAAGALVKPLRATFEDEVPVITLAGTPTFPAAGRLGFDLTETLVSDGWTQVFDWSATGIPEGFNVGKVSVAKAPNGRSGASYRFKANDDGLFVALSGIWVFIR